MGMFRKFDRSSSSFDAKSNILPNPNPLNWDIIKFQRVGKFLLLLVNYPDCTNYEGNKVLLFENTALNLIINQKKIDPHFSDNKKFISPIARFEPTDAGWERGIDFMKMLSKDNCK